MYLACTSSSHLGQADAQNDYLVERLMREFKVIHIYAGAIRSSGWSRPVGAKRGEQHQDEGGDGQNAVDRDDRQREVPFRGKGSSPGE
jgi:hypothetical protein